MYHVSYTMVSSVLPRPQKRNDGGYALRSWLVPRAPLQRNVYLLSPDERNIE